MLAFLCPFCLPVLSVAAGIIKAIYPCAPQQCTYKASVTLASVLIYNVHSDALCSLTNYFYILYKFKLFAQKVLQNSSNRDRINMYSYQYNLCNIYLGGNPNEISFIR